MTLGWIPDRPKTGRGNVHNSFEIFSNMTFDYPWNSPKSPRRLPMITRKYPKAIQNVFNTCSNSGETIDNKCPNTV